MALLLALAACGLDAERDVSLSGDSPVPARTTMTATPLRSPVPGLPVYPEDISPEEAASLQAEEERLNELEAAAPPDTGPTLVIEHYEHEFSTLAQAVAVSEAILIGEVVDEEPGEWREVAGRRERDRFLVVRVEGVLLGDIAEPRIRLRELGDMLQDGLLRERREGGGALQLTPGDRVLLMVIADSASDAYVKVNVDAVQRLQDGEVDDSQRDTAFSRAAEAWTEQELVGRLEAAISATED